ncbi:TIGR02117 family protein [Aquimarina aquimarini]|uniref:TIGR02117 family protein n=1 Tax=Aquimarina aquimarini TaxID=1191734 RepID=UPI000D54D7C7|nr:TIGR02117 family protein [Aquimarina aquimarini]
MRLIKRILKYLTIILTPPLLYLITSLVLTHIPVNNTKNDHNKPHPIYLSSNGVHLDIIIQKDDLISAVLKDQIYTSKAQYFSFGWGDKSFYVETPNWADLTITNGFKALFLESPTLLHVTRYSSIQNDWIELKVDKKQLKKINEYIYKTFQLDSDQKKVLLPGLGYYINDDFYEAKGSYSCFKTCNSWVNSGLKKSNIKACLWTPYDFGVLNMHQQDK